MKVFKISVSALFCFMLIPTLGITFLFLQESKSDTVASKSTKKKRLSKKRRNSRKSVKGRSTGLDVKVADDETSIVDNSAPEEDSDDNYESLGEGMPMAPSEMNVRVVGVNESVTGILGKLGFSRGQIAEILSKDTLPLDFSVQKGARYVVSEYGDLASMDVRFYGDDGKASYMFSRGLEGGSVKRIESEKIETSTIHVEGKLKGSLFASIKKVIPDAGVSYQFFSAYAMDYELADCLKTGARFALDVEQKLSNGQFVGYGQVLSTSLEIKGQMVNRYFTRLSRYGAYIGEEPMTNKPYYSPVDYIQISSVYNPHRWHPRRHRYLPHQGVDFKMLKGEKIYAARDGVIVQKGRARASGKTIVIRHEDGSKAYYEHMSKYGKFKVGESVKTGEVIGYVGCTGYCTGAHLHFAIRNPDGEVVNPVFLTKPYTLADEPKVEIARAELETKRKIELAAKAGRSAPQADHSERRPANL